MKKVILSAFLAICMMGMLTANTFVVATEIMPSQDQIKAEREKAKIAEKYDKAKLKTQNDPSGDLSICYAPSRVNPVGLYRQELPYSCGAAAARNLIAGYVQAQYGTVPDEATLRAALSTTTSGTDFNDINWENTLNTYAPGNSYRLKWGTSNWEYEMRYRVLFTIDQGWTWPYYPYYYFTDGYNVIANMYYTNGVSEAMISYYNKKRVAHYICIHGYDDVIDEYYIVDSNENVPIQYQATFSSTALATQQRGIIW